MSFGTSFRDVRWLALVLVLVVGACADGASSGSTDRRAGAVVSANPPATPPNASGGSGVTGTSSAGSAGSSVPAAMSGMSATGDETPTATPAGASAAGVSGQGMVAASDQNGLDAGSPPDAMAADGNDVPADGGSAADCGRADLTWRSARKTNYTSYPVPGSRECIEYNGCMWQGQFAACNDTKTEAWVAAHNIAAAFPDFASLRLHDLCLRSGDKTMTVTVYDTCGDSDCSGCCTRNQGDADQLIDLESYTNERWGLQDGRIEWADLGPTAGSGCD